jgi:hypothetical protein
MNDRFTFPRIEKVTNGEKRFVINERRDLVEVPVLQYIYYRNRKYFLHHCINKHKDMYSITDYETGYAVTKEAYSIPPSAIAEMRNIIDKNQARLNWRINEIKAQHPLYNFEILTLKIIDVI